MATLSRACLLRQFTDCRRELVPALFERCNISRRAVTHFGGQHSNPCTLRSTFLIHRSLLVCKSVSTREAPEETEDEAALGGGQGPPDDNDGEGDGEGSGGAMGRLTSAFIFAVWAAFIGYCALLSPNQTPTLDVYFLEKFLNLKSNDGFQMNQVMTCLWYIMGLWPVIYSMLLIPTGRSSRNKIPVWPFASLSVFAGAFALLPYFALWEPSALKVSGQEMEGLPLRILDSKIFALVVGIAGVGLFGAAASAGVESWSEFIRFFNSSRFIHIMSLDCIALSFFAPFWIMNDMESRRWSNKDGWGQALAFIPFLGPIVYLILRPPAEP